MRLVPFGQFIATAAHRLNTGLRVDAGTPAAPVVSGGFAAIRGHGRRFAEDSAPVPGAGFSMVRSIVPVEEGAHDAPMKAVLRSPLPVKRARAAGGPQAGFTLLEIVIVLGILVLLAGLIVATTGSVVDQAPADATKASMSHLRDAIGAYYKDVGRMPATVGNLFSQPAGVPPWDPVARVGWNGPYLQTATGTYAVGALAGFTTTWGADGAPAAIDGWNCPIILQVPDGDGDWIATPPDANEVRHARLVSAGPDGIIQIPAAPPVGAGTYLLPNLSQCGDDLVLYVRVADTRAP